ncbi:hypothetical protein BHM03_00029541 [Ensete ventricosum]|nr:hypothetical protein BHM03_00029541 [Ensete ventricosum]
MVVSETSRGKNAKRKVALTRQISKRDKSWFSRGRIMWVTREWVGEGELQKKRTQSEVAEALRCAGRGYMWRDRSPSSSYKNLYAIEMSLGGDMLQRIVVE